ncbi:MAG: hypothetical protein Q8S73_24560 [Deltaproteobacteria bacterium]|nr:hypothetical protein [Myxococcales bacterium]MDP3217307.1 hypothetical protein [Deltaproteobacteria bacterium]
MERATQVRGRGNAVELWLWTILAASLALSAMHALPTAARDAALVAAGLVALALFAGRASQLRAVS